jgi:hypothetical protein
MKPLPRPAVLRVKLLRARRRKCRAWTLPGKANYFIGRDPTRWRTDVAGYAKLRCRGVYPAIDLLYYGRGRELEYDFVVALGGDPTRIRLRFEGARSLRVDGEGQLVAALDGGFVVNRAPRIYQEEGTRKVPVRGRWILRRGQSR